MELKSSLPCSQKPKIDPILSRINPVNSEVLTVVTEKYGLLGYEAVSFGRNLLTLRRKELPSSSALKLLVLWVRNTCCYSSSNIRQKALHCKLFILNWQTGVCLASYRPGLCYYCGRDSDSLRAGRSGVRTLWGGVRFSGFNKSGPEAHPDSCTMGTGCLSQG